MTTSRHPIADWTLDTLHLVGPARVLEVTSKTTDAIRKASSPNERRSLAVADLVVLAAERVCLGHPSGLDDAINAEVAMACARIGASAADTDPRSVFMRVTAEVGDVGRVLAEAMRDGRMTSPERRQCTEEIDEAMRAFAALRHAMAPGLKSA